MAAQQKPADQEKRQQPLDKEQAMMQRINKAQMNGNDSDFHEANHTFMEYLERRQEWDKYYRTWLNSVIYEVNHKHFHRAFTEIHLITDHIKEHHQEQYLYISNMGLGFFFNGRNQPEMGEKYFRRALQGIDASKEPVAVFNAYLSLAQSLSFKRPAEAMACLDSLPEQMLDGPMTQYRPITVHITHSEQSGVTALDFMVEQMTDTPLTDAQRNELSAECRLVIEEPTKRGFRVKLII